VSDQPTVEGTVILEIRSHPSGSVPTIEIHHGDYVSYWMNTKREQLVFVRRRGEDYATLYHRDAEWAPVTLTPTMSSREVDISQLEHLWLSLCWRASNPLHR
jgi:hypothetical protein